MEAKLATSMVAQQPKPEKRAQPEAEPEPELSGPELEAAAAREHRARKLTDEPEPAAPRL